MDRSQKLIRTPLLKNFLLSNKQNQQAISLMISFLLDLEVHLQMVDLWIHLLCLETKLMEQSLFQLTDYCPFKITHLFSFGITNQYPFMNPDQFLFLLTIILFQLWILTKEEIKTFLTIHQEAQDQIFKSVILQPKIQEAKI